MEYIKDIDKIPRVNNHNREKIKCLLNKGYVFNEFGSFSDPDNPLRAGGYIDGAGNIHMDM